MKYKAGPSIGGFLVLLLLILFVIATLVSDLAAPPAELYLSLRGMEPWCIHHADFDAMLRGKAFSDTVDIRTTAGGVLLSGTPLQLRAAITDSLWK